MAHDQVTMLPQMFNTFTLNDPTQEDWYMDTGVTAHLHANQGILNSVKNNALTSSVLVGDGSRIPINASGDTYIPSSYFFRPLHLNRVLIDGFWS